MHSKSISAAVLTGGANSVSPRGSAPYVALMAKPTDAWYSPWRRHYRESASLVDLLLDPDIDLAVHFAR
jgi:hypothetical protein